MEPLASAKGTLQSVVIRSRSDGERVRTEWFREDNTPACDPAPPDRSRMKPARMRRSTALRLGHQLRGRE